MLKYKNRTNLHGQFLHFFKIYFLSARDVYKRQGLAIVTEKFGQILPIARLGNFIVPGDSQSRPRIDSRLQITGAVYLHLKTYFFGLHRFRPVKQDIEPVSYTHLDVYKRQISISDS